MVSYQTLREYVRQGRLRGVLTASGQRVYTRAELDAFLRSVSGDAVADERVEGTDRVVFYVRDSEGDKERMGRQRAELTEAYGEPLYCFQDKGSGLNERRRGLNRLLDMASQKSFDVVCVTQPDRLTRFGYSFLERYLGAYGVRIRVLHERPDKSLHEELMQDFMSLIASFSGKYYKLRSLRSQERLLEKAGEDVHRRMEERSGGEE